MHAALAAAQTGFALFPIFGKLALVSISPFVLAAIRVVSAAVLLELVRRASGAQPIPRADRPQLVLFALLGVSFNQVLFILGLSMTTAIHTTILMSSIPVFTLATAALLRHETLSTRAVAGMLLAGMGALLLLSARGFDWQSRYFRGDLLLLANCLSYSLFLVLSRPILARCEPLTFVAAIFRYGAIPIVLVSLPAMWSFLAVVRDGGGVGQPGRDRPLLHRDPLLLEHVGARAHRRVPRRRVRLLSAARRVGPGDPRPG